VALLIVKDVQHHSVDVYSATPEQVKSFNEADLHVAVMGWEVRSANELAATSLTKEEMCALNNRHTGKDGAILPHDRSKREVARLIWDGLPKFAKPYDLSPAKGDYYPAPKAATPQRPATPKEPVKRLSRDEEWETTPTKPVPQKATGCTAKLMDALMTPGGVTIDSLKLIVPNWQESSITSALHTDVRGKAGYGVKKVKVNGVFHYSLVLPEGMTSPLPHIVPKGK
jgi:hypothetical protein